MIVINNTNNNFFFLGLKHGHFKDTQEQNWTKLPPDLPSTLYIVNLADIYKFIIIIYNLFFSLRILHKQCFRTSNTLFGLFIRSRVWDGFPMTFN